MNRIGAHVELFDGGFAKVLGPRLALGGEHRFIDRNVPSFHSVDAWSGHISVLIDRRLGRGDTYQYRKAGSASVPHQCLMKRAVKIAFAV